MRVALCAGRQSVSRDAGSSKRRLRRCASARLPAFRPTLSSSITPVLASIRSTASASAWAQECLPPAGRLVSLQGSVEHRRGGDSTWIAVQSGVQLCSGDTLRVGQLSRAALLLPNETTLRLDQATTLT